VLAIEEGDRFTFDMGFGAFRAGEAFGPKHRNWAFGGFATFGVAF
jgi:hypothetical protein